MKAKNSPNRVRSIRRRLLAWYKTSARPLPWRKTRDAYKILLSEIMLQQTQVNRVMEHYPRFLKRFPSIRSLAAARTRNVISEWSGMGYNNRAVRLHRLAREVVAGFGGRIPRSVPILEHLPGVGPYTARAVASFAFGQRHPIVETNVRRVFSRVFPGTSSAEEAWILAEAILPRKNVYQWNQALMELGALVCTASNPGCSRCPLAEACPSAFTIAKRNARRRKEPGLAGIPNRIYRGRIVEKLRNLRGRRMIAVDTLGKEILKGYTKREHAWLRNLLHGLERDGLIALSGGLRGKRVSLAE